MLRMKLSAFILVLIFFKASVLPSCSTGHYCAEEETHHSQHQEQDSDQGHCGSACICFGCGLNYVVEDYILSSITMPVSTNELTVEYSDLYDLSVMHAIWHPPALV